MERSWLPAVILGGGAVLLVGGFVLFGGGSPSPPAATDSPSTTIATADAPLAEVRASDEWSTATPPPVVDPAPMVEPTVITSASIAPTATDAESPNVLDEKLPAPGKGPEGRIKAHIAKLRLEIARLESDGKHDEAAKKQKLLDRMQAKLGVVQNGL